MTDKNSINYNNSNSSKTSNNSSIPLCVDLDYTLVATDMLFESVLLLLKKNPLYIFLIIFWLSKGKAQLKNEIFSRVAINTASLPYRQNIIDYIKKEKANNRHISLVTASPQSVANSISEHLGLFDSVYGTDKKTNLKSKNKQSKLIELFGEKKYDYMGDSTADLKVWESANKTIIVSNSSSLALSASKVNANYEHIKIHKKGFAKSVIKEIRVYQWVKNILIFLPVLMAHLLQFDLILNSIIAFFSFSFVASSVYLTNDLLDLESDRLHPRKKKRPIASGDLSIPFSVFLSVALLCLGFGLSCFVSNSLFTIVLLAYYLLTTMYSFTLKKIVIMDIMTLALLYTIRIIAGGVATSVELSPWLLAFSLFIFLSLAVVKRYTELLVIKEQKKTKIKGRGYQTSDIELLLSIGPASGYLAVLIFALYVNSEQVTKLYQEPMYMWLVAVLFLYWITRVWFLAHRGEMTDDPIVFTVKDKISWIIGLCIAVLAVLASGQFL